MKSVITIVFAALISGCSILVPVKPKFPEAVPELKIKCPELKEVDSKTQNITDMLKIIVDNYGAHYQCSNKVDGWIEWYDFQRENFNNPKKK